MRVVCWLVALAVAGACSNGAEVGVDAGPDGAGVDYGGDPGAVDHGYHPDVPAVVPEGACAGDAAPAVAFHHGFEPGETLPDDPGYHGFAMVEGGACPGDAGGQRSLAWDGTLAEGAYASWPAIDVPGPAVGTPALSFCLVFASHAGDQLRIDAIADAGDPETVWSSSATEPAEAHMVTVSLAPWSGQRAQFSLHFSRGDEAAEPARDVRLDALAVFSCPSD